MTIGLSTYAFFWRHSARAHKPLSVEEMVDLTASAGAEVLQICDYPAIDDFVSARLKSLRAQADTAGISIELGTRGVDRAHLERYLEIASTLDAHVVRTMLYTTEHRPTTDEAEGNLRAVLPAYRRAGVTLALETYEQVATARLVELVERIDQTNLGICLDPANCVAALESPRDIIDQCADRVVNWHAKDFRFARHDGLVGFSLLGCPLGEGQLDLDYLYDRVQPVGRGISQIIEHWLPWQGDIETTVALEEAWTEHNLTYLRSR